MQIRAWTLVCLAAAEAAKHTRPGILSTDTEFLSVFGFVGRFPWISGRVPTLPALF